MDACGRGEYGTGAYDAAHVARAPTPAGCRYRIITATHSPAAMFSRSGGITA
jgi:hypothetical protein